jgi:N-acetyl sugar amidotransferase
MDTSDPDIVFDASGQCNHCTGAKKIFEAPPFNLSTEERRAALEASVAAIKQRAAGRRYDCVIGLSGGVDSSYVAYVTKKELGLRPLAVHLDNGWDSETSVSNIENICRRLDIDLNTYVIDWEEFKDLQLSFLKASTPDSEIPSDHAIVSVLYQVAIENRIKVIVGGTNDATESILPFAWSAGHMDWKYISAVQRQFGKKRLLTFPHRSLFRHLLYKTLYSIQWFSLLNYIPYDKEKAKVILKSELGWKDYGRKHGESNYTRIFQEHILPQKFGYDKRRAHLSSMIVAGLLSRETALKELEQPLYGSKEALNEDIRFLCSKLGISQDEFKSIMESPRKTILDYPSYENSSLMKAVWRLAKRIGRIR